MSDGSSQGAGMDILKIMREMNSVGNRKCMKKKKNLYAELFSSSFKMFKKLYLEGIVCSCLSFLLTSDEEGVSEEDARTVWGYIPASDPNTSK